MFTIYYFSFSFFKDFIECLLKALFAAFQFSNQLLGAHTPNWLYLSSKTIDIENTTDIETTTENTTDYNPLVDAEDPVFFATFVGNLAELSYYCLLLELGEEAAPEASSSTEHFDASVSSFPGSLDGSAFEACGDCLPIHENNDFQEDLVGGFSYSFINPCFLDSGASFKAIEPKLEADLFICEHGPQDTHELPRACFGGVQPVFDPLVFEMGCYEHSRDQVSCSLAGTLPVVRV